MLQRSALRLALPCLLSAPRNGLLRACSGGSGPLLDPGGLKPSGTGGSTIFALSSGAGVRAGVSVIRISGPQASDVLVRMAPGRTDPIPAPRRAVVRTLRRAGEGSAQGAEVIDHALVLWFPGPRSFTGEDTVELHTHGSRAVVSATLEALGELPGLRLAEPGEFTRQAFGNGRLELTELEGLADLINADTEVQRKQALAQMAGVQRDTFERWRGVLIKALANTEALIDFGEDADDVTEAALGAALSISAEVRAEMVEQMMDGGRGEAVRDGIRVAILGPPNAGKSSLLNLLAQRDAAIVSPTAGTTRDVVSVTLELAGLPVIIADTAGLRSQTDDPIEVQGMQRARAEARRAHLQLWVYDAATPPEDIALLSASASGDAHSSDGDDPPVPRLLVLNKVDLLSNAAAAATPCSGFLPDRQWHISCLTQQGVQPFLDSLSSLVGSIYGGDEREAALVTRARHRQHLSACIGALDAFESLAALGDSAPLDLASEELRTAANELGRITGRVDVEELLDVIFRDFCIGK